MTPLIWRRNAVTISDEPWPNCQANGVCWVFRGSAVITLKPGSVINCLCRRKFGVYRSTDPTGNQDGGILIAFAIFMGVVVLALSLYSTRWAQLYDSKRLREICRSELATHYRQVGKQIEGLLRLNTAVTAIRLEEKAAHAALVAALVAVNPPAVTAAQTWTKNIQMRKRLLRAAQQTLIRTGNLILLQIPLQVFRKLRREPRHRGLIVRDLAWMRGGAPKMAVQPADSDPILPKYELVPQFEKRQSVELNWQSRFHRSSGDTGSWLIANTNIRESCGMTLKNQGDNTFTPAPTQDKYFWRH